MLESTAIKVKIILRFNYPIQTLRKQNIALLSTNVKTSLTNTNHGLQV
jgi:hypothetical protein